MASLPVTDEEVRKLLKSGGAKLETPNNRPSDLKKAEKNKKAIPSLTDEEVQKMIESGEAKVEPGLGVADPKIGEIAADTVKWIAEKWGDHVVHPENDSRGAAGSRQGRSLGSGRDGDADHRGGTCGVVGSAGRGRVYISPSKIWREASSDKNPRP